VIFGNIGEKKYYLEKGTIWLPKNDKDKIYQPLVQKNRILIDKNYNNQRLFMFCGDQSKKVPQKIEYIPTDVIILDPVSQHDVWAKTNSLRIQGKTDL